MINDLTRRESRLQLLTQQLDISETMKKLWAQMDEATLRRDTQSYREIEKDWLALHRQRQAITEQLDSLRED